MSPEMTGLELVMGVSVAAVEVAACFLGLWLIAGGPALTASWLRRRWRTRTRPGYGWPRPAAPEEKP